MMFQDCKKRYKKNKECKWDTRNGKCEKTDKFPEDESVSAPETEPETELEVEPEPETEPLPSKLVS